MDDRRVVRNGDVERTGRQEAYDCERKAVRALLAMDRDADPARITRAAVGA